uniref:G-patch domain and ankyrin repeats 1 n=1 Tax=Cyprinodon variegatus TaxID=28743 RepID=A0A3Q2EGA7_CYPVA
SRLMAALGFIPASEKDAFSVRSEPISSNRSSKLSGEEVRRFYEDLMKDDTTRAERSKRATNKNNHDRGSNRRARRAAAERVQQENTDSVAQRDRRNQREAVNSERVQELMGLRLLRCAHQGDISGLKELISKGVDINFQDTYLWTAVMCASWAGQQDAVRLLLRQGAAWVGVVDTRGRDAQDLAREGIFMLLCTLLCYHISELCLLISCESCDEGIGHSSHLSSTLHQFSEHHPQPSPYYCLPPSSNSYKMMVRCGWKPGTGLGPEADGPKQPVSTVLKRDHKGLGFGPVKRAKVTHFKAGDQSAVKHRPQDREERGRKGQKKDETKRREQKDRNWERDFRLLHGGYINIENVEIFS